METPKFTITYLNDVVFEGDSLREDWKNVNDGIKSLKFTFGGISVYIENFFSYNHLIERVSIVGKKDQNTITKYLIMGRLEKSTHIYEFDLKERKSKKYIVPIGQEYKRQILSGWKEGHKEGVPKFKHGKF